MNEYIIIYKPIIGGKYSCLTVIEETAQKAKEFAFSNYSYFVDGFTFVKVVKIGRAK